MQHIETVTLSTSQSSITFSAIPQDFTDLMLLTSLRNSDTSDFFGLGLNASSTDFTQVNLRGEGTSVLTQSRTDNLIVGGACRSGDTANTFSNGNLYISNYTSASNKSFSFDGSIENNATDGRNAISRGLLSDTSAITSIVIDANANFVAGSTISLYGITAGSDGTTTVS